MSINSISNSITKAIGPVAKIKSKEFFPNGRLRRVICTNGDALDWHKNSKRACFSDKQGRIKAFGKDGKIIFEHIPDVGNRFYEPDGSFEEHSMMERIVKYFDSNKTLREEYLPDGTHKKWDENGKLIHIDLPV